MIEDNQESSAFKELLGLESQEKGLDFSILEDTQKIINTDEEESSMDKKSVKKIVNFLIEALKKL